METESLEQSLELDATWPPIVTCISCWPRHPVMVATALVIDTDVDHLMRGKLNLVTIAGV